MKSMMTMPMFANDDDGYSSTHDDDDDNGDGLWSPKSTHDDVGNDDYDAMMFD